MRTQSSWSQLGSNNRSNHGNQHAAAVQAEIAYAGQPLTARSRNGASDAGTTWTVQTMPQTAQPGDVKLLIEAGENIAEAAPTVFYFDNAQTIAEGNELAFDGHWYKLGKLYPTPFQGISILNYAVGVRGERIA